MFTYFFWLTIFNLFGMGADDDDYWFTQFLRLELKKISLESGSRYNAMDIFDILNSITPLTQTFEDINRVINPLSYLSSRKYEEGKPDVVGSFSMNRDENLTVVANRKNISDKEAFARLLLKMYKENSFHSIKFSTDSGYATSLDMTVYSWKEDIENGESIMQIEFRPIEYGKDYDVVSSSDKYVLFIDGKEVK